MGTLVFRARCYPGKAPERALTFLKEVMGLLGFPTELASQWSAFAELSITPAAEGYSHMVVDDQRFEVAVPNMPPGWTYCEALFCFGETFRVSVNGPETNVTPYVQIAARNVPSQMIAGLASLAQHVGVEGFFADEVEVKDEPLS